MFHFYWLQSFKGGNPIQSFSPNNICPIFDRHLPNTVNRMKIKCGVFIQISKMDDNFLRLALLESSSWSNYSLHVPGLESAASRHYPPSEHQELSRQKIKSNIQDTFHHPKISLKTFHMYSLKHYSLNFNHNILLASYYPPKTFKHFQNWAFYFHFNS